MVSLGLIVPQEAGDAGGCVGVTISGLVGPDASRGSLLLNDEWPSPWDFTARFRSRITRSRCRTRSPKFSRSWRLFLWTVAALAGLGLLAMFLPSIVSEVSSSSSLSEVVSKLPCDPVEDRFSVSTSSRSEVSPLLWPSSDRSSDIGRTSVGAPIVTPSPSPSRARLDPSPSLETSE